MFINLLIMHYQFNANCHFHLNMTFSKCNYCSIIKYFCLITNAMFSYSQNKIYYWYREAKIYTGYTLDSHKNSCKCIDLKIPQENKYKYGCYMKHMKNSDWY